MQYCAQVEHLHAQVAPDMPMEAFVAAINPQALGFQSRDQLYAPVEFAVQIAGPLNGAAGAIRVQVPVHANPNWHSVMKHRFSSLIGQPLLPLNQLEFRTVDGRSIANVPPEQLRNVGKLHVFVKGKELRLPAVPAIPIEYSVTKMRDIDRWITDTVEEKLPALVARYLSPCQNAEQLQAAVRGDGPLVKAIEAAVQGADRAQWAEFVRTRHVNPPLVMPVTEANKAAQAIANEVLLGEVRKMVDAAAPQIRKHFAELESARIAKDLTGRHNPDHYAPIAGLVAHERGAASADGESTIENVNEFYRNLTEDIVTMPSVREAIAAAIYTRPMTSIGCRWKPGEEPDAKPGATSSSSSSGRRADVPRKEKEEMESQEFGGGDQPGGPRSLLGERALQFKLNASSPEGLMRELQGLLGDKTGATIDEDAAYLAYQLKPLFDGTHVGELEAIVSRFDQDIIDEVPIEQPSTFARFLDWWAGITELEKSEAIAKTLIKRYRLTKNPTARKKAAKPTSSGTGTSVLADGSDEKVFAFATSQREIITDLDKLFVTAPGASEEEDVNFLMRSFSKLFDGTHVDELQNLADKFNEDIRNKVPVHEHWNITYGAIGALRAAGKIASWGKWNPGTMGKDKSESIALAIVQRYRLIKKTTYVQQKFNQITRDTSLTSTQMRNNMIEVLKEKNVPSILDLGNFEPGILLAICRKLQLVADETTQTDPAADPAALLRLLNRFLTTIEVPSSSEGSEGVVEVPAATPKLNVPEQVVLQPKGGGGESEVAQFNMPKSPEMGRNRPPPEESSVVEEVPRQPPARKAPKPPTTDITVSAEEDRVDAEVVNQYATTKSLLDYFNLVQSRWNTEQPFAEVFDEALNMYLGGQKWNANPEVTYVTKGWMTASYGARGRGTESPFGEIELDTNWSPKEWAQKLRDIQEFLREGLTDEGSPIITPKKLGDALKARSAAAAKAANMESSIEAHHPWNAMIHNTIRPMLGGAYPAYYNALHTKQDMTTQAKFMGNPADAYRAYHLFGGVPIAPLRGLQRIGCHAKERKPCERTQKYSEKIYTKARDAAKADRDADITRDSAAYRSQVRGETLRRPPMDMESEVPPLVPMTRSKAPPVIPIGNKAPPVIPIGNKAPPVLPIGCGASSGDEEEEPMHTKADISESRARMLLGSMFDSSDDETADLSPRVIRSSIPPCPPTIAAPMALIEDEDDNPFGMPTLKQALAAKKY